MQSILYYYLIVNLSLETYQVQTNLSMQTIETSIWVIRSTSKGRGVERWEGGFAKVWLPNPRAGSNYKITQSPIPLEYWSNDSDWSFHSLHGEVDLHLIRCPIVRDRKNLIHIQYNKHFTIPLHFFGNFAFLLFFSASSFKLIKDVSHSSNLICLWVFILPSIFEL